ncbi:hypothetical protein BGY98DRAFT_937609 [Russula aff. rugulosa BPL654]|nr:hypothetical protein BGY98DRAFT_937609 [Russula aff. rugulosa BPL654]
MPSSWESLKLDLVWGFSSPDLLFRIFARNTTNGAQWRGPVLLVCLRIRQSGSPSRFLTSAFDNPIIGSFVTGTVQFFFAYRVWVLSDKRAWWHCVTIVVYSAINAVSAFARGIYVADYRVGWASLEGKGHELTVTLRDTHSLQDDGMLRWGPPACVLSFWLFRPSGELSGTCGIISMLTVIIFPDDPAHWQPIDKIGQVLLYLPVLQYYLENLPHPSEGRKGGKVWFPAKD